MEKWTTPLFHCFADQSSTQPGMMMLGYCYDKGIGTEIRWNCNKSIYWFEKSAKQGNQGAQNTLC
ncbi:hypothetical protein RhiirA1_478312 [Rhizophagus irregularis]|uniref:Uncharacterized protein n=1 Tax=Rhizophagus irregularis TaxID=588596 RepID=A0A2N0QS94_9GLOM|nr:hypothetical protein RhiirA1_478312 [Rhizophagus irregularis]